MNEINHLLYKFQEIANAPLLTIEIADIHLSYTKYLHIDIVFFRLKAVN